MKKVFFSVLKTIIFAVPVLGYATPNFQPQAELSPTILSTGFFGDSYGQVLHYHEDDNYLFVGAIVSRPDPAKVAEGAVYVYVKQNGDWIATQTIVTEGFSDHLSALTIKAYGRWLFISAIGTPIGPFPGDAVNTQDFTGSIQIYYRNNLGQYNFIQAIDRTTLGLEDLTVVDPADLAPVPPPAPTVEHGAAFGLSFDLTEDHNYLLVGAATQQNTVEGQPLINSGKVFSFKNNGNHWDLVQSFVNPEGPTVNGSFGGAVKISKDYALISTATLTTNATVNGKSYVFLYQLVNELWQPVQKIQSDQTVGLPVFSPVFGGNVLMGDNFGTVLDFDGNWAIVGAPLAHLDTNGIKGAAYIYQLKEVNGIKQLVFKQKIVTDVSPSSSDYNNSFLTGFAVAIRGKTALIADPTHVGPQGQTAQGAIMVYQRNGSNWTHTTNLFDPNGFAYELFSNGVDLSKKYIFGGTGTAVPALYLNIFFSPPFLSTPLPVLPNKVVIWKY